ncbi:MAG: right-handed parallel beta-helix repeat-containing protein [Anaerolineae bacterium]
MTSKRVGIVLLVALGWTLGCLWALSGDQARAAPPPSAELHVCPSGCAYSSIQTAVDAADDGDVIKVAQGTYTDVHTLPSLSTATFTATQSVAITKSVTLRGGYAVTDWTTPDPDAHPTILDAREAGRVLVIVGSGIAPTIEGLRLTGGDATGLGGSVYDLDAGGGLYVLGGSAVISDSQVYGNNAYRGAGVWLQDCTVTFRANEVRANTAGWAGGGLWLYRSPANLADNRVVSNTAIYAGGVALHLSNAELSGNSVLSNTATSSEGGGVAILSSKAVLDGNVIRANRVDEAGGGLFLSLSDATLTNNVIADNYANRLGSGLHVSGGSPRLVHNTIARNSGWGGGLYAVTSTVGIVSDVRLTNTIVFSHTEGIIAARGNTVTLHATLWHANLTDWIGPGTINHTNDHSGDPAFAADGYHLASGSSAIDPGVDAGIATDVDGDVRPQGAGYDLGADEFLMAPATVTLSGPVQGKVGASYTFTATVAPPATTLPITYTWQASEHAPVVGTTGLSDTHPFTWTTWGAQTVTVTVANAGSTTAVSDTLTIEIAPYRVYLPLVLR